MKLDLTELLGGRKSALHFDYAFDPAHAEGDCAQLPGDVTIPPEGIRVTGDAKDAFGTLMFSAHVTVSYETRCARCLDPVSRSVEFDMERLILTDQRLIREDQRADRTLSHLSEDGEWDGVTDDILTVNEGKLSPDADILEEVSLSIPTFDLCEPDCPGLCPRCGKRLRDGDCGCREEKILNPKLAVLKTLLDKDPEGEE